MDLTPIALIQNSTVQSFVDTRSWILNNNDLSEDYTMSCELWFLDNPDTSSDSFSLAHTNYNSFSCTTVNATTNNIIATIHNFTAGQLTTFESDLAAEDYNIHFIIFPVRNATMISNLDSNNLKWGLQNHLNELYITGDGVTCWLIKESKLCNLIDEPWTAISKALGQDYIGDWFYVLVFFPFPMAVFLFTRNGTYAGFVGLGITLAIQTIDQTIFEIALSMIFISAGFAFYEVVRKRLME